MAGKYSIKKMASKILMNFLSNSYNIRIQEKLQGYPSRCAKPPDDFTTKVPFGPGQAQAELLF